MYYSFCYVSVEQNCIHKYIMLYISLLRSLHLWDNCLSISTLSYLYSLFHCSGPSRPASALRTLAQTFPSAVLLSQCCYFTLSIHPCDLCTCCPCTASGSHPAFGVHAVWVPCMEIAFPQVAPGLSPAAPCALSEPAVGWGAWRRDVVSGHGEVGLDLLTLELFSTLNNSVKHSRPRPSHPVITDAMRASQPKAFEAWNRIHLFPKPVSYCRHAQSCTPSPLSSRWASWTQMGLPQCQASTAQLPKPTRSHGLSSN